MKDDGTNHASHVASGSGSGKRSAATPVLILDQPFDRGSLYPLRETLEAHAVHAGLPHGRAVDLVLTVHELATNAIFHGSGTGRARIWRLDGVLRCEVADPGSSRHDAAEWPVRHGHGLWLARYLSDRFTIDSGPDGTVATAHFTLPKPASRRPATPRLRRLESHAVLELDGALDEQAAPELTATVGELASGTPAPGLVIDLSAVTYWDSTGITALIAAQQRVSETASGMLILTGLAAEFAERLDALSPVPFTICETPDKAVHLFPPP
ncbi:ATP-binding protein [Microbispora sp. NEAU-D428]|uniref:ATP-binding protein n=1 Tax=Microbispora sitophila TaxID=2771537 RepID=UPI001865AFD3|nr:ATP-binding protein [Microbispora sitophila]MBE3010352.1 ATP-binding protein [Microbispora sitophila]